MLGFHHGAVGATLLDRWRLPAALVEAVAWHHAPRLSSRHPLETAVVHVADVIANGLSLGSSGEHLVPSFEPPAWDILDLSPTVLPGLFRQVELQFNHAVEAIMGMEH